MIVALFALLSFFALSSAYNTTGQVTVSGISAGGFMASQYHVAFSTEVSGAAIFAGGPYYCARAEIANALTACMSYPFLLDVNELINDAQSFASNGSIDPVSGLAGDNVFLYSGTQDSVVKTDVVKAAETFYKSFNANVSTQYTIQSEHCQPTMSFGNPCTQLGTPYISKCDYDGAGAALSALFAPATLKPASKYVQLNLKKIDQSKYYPGGQSVSGLDTTAYVYVPTACQSGVACRVHISFHGCNQELESIGKVYVENSGYLPWAESNNIIVLFPQAVPDYLKENPEACFDWWGYTGSDYSFKTAAQMQTFRNMVLAIKSPQGPIFVN